MMLLHAVHFDFMFALISVVAGAALFVSRMSICGRCVHSPFLYIFIICFGSFSWLVFGFLAVSAALDYGGLHSMGYRGHWGYTFARSLGFTVWLATLYIINEALMDHDKQTK